MFDIGLPEFVVLAIAALFLFGPERLPEVARKAAGMLRQVRTMAANARRDLTDELGPEFENFDVRDLNPRNAIKKYVLDGIDEDDLRIDKHVDDLREDIRKLDDPDEPASRALEPASEDSSGTPGHNGSTPDAASVSDPSAAGSSSSRAAATATATAGEGTSVQRANGASIDDAIADGSATSGGTTLATRNDPPFDPDAT